MAAQETINFNPEKLERFRAAYEWCEGEWFFFEDQKVLKAYAKYMIEHLDNVFKSRRKSK
jgi:hypothetical protein